MRAVIEVGRWTLSSTVLALVVGNVGCVPERIEPKSPVLQDPNARPGVPGGSTHPEDEPEAALVSLAVSAAAPTVAVGESLQLIATGTFDDDTIEDLTDDVEWSTSDAALGRLEGASGVLHAAAEGTVTITARLGDLSAALVVTTTPPILRSISIAAGAAAPVVLARGETVQLVVTGTYGDGSKLELLDAVAFTVSSPAVSVDESGLLTALGLGLATVTAAAEGLTATLDVEVKCAYPGGAPATIQSGDVVPNLSWPNAYGPDGEPSPLDLEAVHCGAAGYETTKAIVFVIGAGWCPYCPDYMRAVNAASDQIEAAGGMIVYVEIEDASRRAARSDYAYEHIGTIIGDGPGLRVGDADTTPSRAIGRAPFVTSLPNQFVVRTSDMTVIDTGQTSTSNLLRTIQDL